MWKVPHFDPERHHRRSIRRRGHDYATPGPYFVTFCARERWPHFGRAVQGATELNALGRIAHEEWLRIPQRHVHVRLHAFVVMPDHIHGIIELIGRPLPPHGALRNGPAPGSLGAIIGSYRAGVTRVFNATRDRPVHDLWQRGYYDIIIRDRRTLDRVTAYIERHPRMVMPPAT